MARPSKRLADRVYDSVVEQIRGGSLVGGDRLVEDDLAKQNEVSRTPVREAIQKLILNGYAVPDQSGLVVSAPSEAEIFDAYVLRETLEGLASRLAASRCSDVDALRLTAIHERFKAACSSGDAATAIELTLEFHDRIWQMSGSDILQRVMRDLIDAFWTRVTPSTLASHNRLADCDVEHEDLWRAIIERRPEDASEAPCATSATPATRASTEICASQPTERPDGTLSPGSPPDRRHPEIA